MRTSGSRLRSKNPKRSVRCTPRRRRPS